MPKVVKIILIVAGVLIGLVIITAILAVPQLLHQKKVANEVSALQTMRTIEQAELQYDSSFPARGFACSLASLGGEPGRGEPTPEAAQILPKELSTGHKSGYIFTISDCTQVTVNGAPRITSFHVFGVPETVGKSGDRGFCSDENNVIKYDPQGGTSCTSSLQ